MHYACMDVTFETPFFMKQPTTNKQLYLTAELPNCQSADESESVHKKNRKTLNSLLFLTLNGPETAIANRYVFH